MAWQLCIIWFSWLGNYLALGSRGLAITSRLGQNWPNLGQISKAPAPQGALDLGYQQVVCGSNYGLQKGTCQCIGYPQYHTTLSFGTELWPKKFGGVLAYGSLIACYLYAWRERSGIHSTILPHCSTLKCNTTTLHIAHLYPLRTAGKGTFERGAKIARIWVHK